VVGAASEALAILGEGPDTHAGLMSACQEAIGSRPAKARDDLSIDQGVKYRIVLEALSHASDVSGDIRHLNGPTHHSKVPRYH